MNNIDIGSKIKELRTQSKLTLKQLSEKTELSVGFLSQLERGMTSIAIDSLSKIASVFNVELSSFFENEEKYSGDNVVRGYEKRHTKISPQIIQYTLSKNIADFSFLPREFHLMPYMTYDKGDVELYHHVGEEFIYVLEGVLTLEMDGGQYTLNPSDSIQIHSDVNHNWINKTNRVTRILCINIPNPFKK